MVALMAGAIAPVMVISVATRVNSQRAEQALALAQGEIDTTRVLVERGDYAAADLPPVAQGVTDRGIRDADGPDLSVTDESSFDYAQPIDIDGDGQDNFLVQRFRAAGQLGEDGIPIAFAMGVRVYDINVDGTGNLPTDPASLAIRSGEGDRSSRPLAALYTTIAVGEQGDSLCDFIEYTNRRRETPLSDAQLSIPPTCNPPNTSDDAADESADNT